MRHGGIGKRVCVVLLILAVAAGVFLLVSAVANMPWSLLGRTM
jgi:hypothetical protein